MNIIDVFRKMRFRFVYMVLFTIVALLALFLSDPDLGLIQGLSYGAGFIATCVVLTKVIIYVATLHVSRRALVDYLDLQKYFEKALEEPMAAAVALVSVAIMMLCITLIILHVG